MSIENILNLNEREALGKASSDREGFRALWNARQLAKYLVKSPDQLSAIIVALADYYRFHSDQALYQEHQVAILNLLHKQPALWKKILSAYTSIDFPAEYVRYALQLKKQEKIEDTHAAAMLLSAALTPLRQSIGSCFATAPAMTVQRYNLEMFIDDCLELMQTGRLKRVFEGAQHTVPLSPSWGEGELDRPLLRLDNPLFLLALQGANPKHGAKTVREALGSEEACSYYKSFAEHPLLKSWEYTLASFCDYKVELYKWNLQAALGFDPNDLGGIGQIMHAFVSERLEKANQTMMKHQLDIEETYGQMKLAENFFKDATSYDQARRHKALHTAHSFQFEQSLQSRDDAKSQAENYAKFFNYLTSQYRSYFEAYFQEVFDPQILDVNPELFADSPAGFRLIYKHGREKPSQWTLIQNKDEYLFALMDFFRMTENQLIATCDWEEGKKAIVDLTTEIVLHLQTEDFITSAQKRVIQMHQKSQTGAMHLTPWSYLSGGSMEHLLRCYFCVENPIAKEEKIVLSPTDLLIFYIEVMKSAKPFVVESGIPLFAYSPTHAFRLMPQLESFKNAWMDKGFTYTWVRDNYVDPGYQFYAKQTLSSSEQRDLLKRMGIESNFSRNSLSLREFRMQVIGQYPRAISLIDGLLLECKPGVKPLYFADTNWPGLFFAFAVNPGTLELDLWRSDLQFKHPRPMHMWQNDLNGTSQKPWGVFMHKFF